jgi:hypothetical protein
MSTPHGVKVLAQAIRHGRAGMAPRAVRKDGKLQNKPDGTPVFVSSMWVRGQFTAAGKKSAAAKLTGGEAPEARLLAAAKAIGRMADETTDEVKRLARIKGDDGLPLVRTNGVSPALVTDIVAKLDQARASLAAYGATWTAKHGDPSQRRRGRGGRRVNRATREAVWSYAPHSPAAGVVVYPATTPFPLDLRVAVHAALRRRRRLPVRWLGRTRFQCPPRSNRPAPRRPRQERDVEVGRGDRTMADHSGRGRAVDRGHGRPPPRPRSQPAAARGPAACRTRPVRRHVGPRPAARNAPSGLLDGAGGASRVRSRFPNRWVLQPDAALRTDTRRTDPTQVRARGDVPNRGTRLQVVRRPMKSADGTSSQPTPFQDWCLACVMTSAERRVRRARIRCARCSPAARDPPHPHGRSPSPRRTGRDPEQEVLSGQTAGSPRIPHNGPRGACFPHFPPSF